MQLNQLNQDNFFITKYSSMWEKDVVAESLKRRRKRPFCNFYTRSSKFSAGDILSFVYKKEIFTFRFTGICLSIRGKSITKPETSILLRNVIYGVGVEFVISYYYNRIYKLTILDYKRKRFVYKKSKLFFLRERVNQATRV